MIIKSKRLILRPFKKSDEKSLIENINDWKVSRCISTVPYPYRMKDAKKWIAHCIKSLKSKNKKEIVFAVDKNGEVIGSIGLHDINKNHKAEIGYWLAKRFWNKGIITEAIKITTEYGFKRLKLKRIYASVYLKNEISAHVLEKNHYKREGLLRNYALKNGECIDCFMYAKIK